MTIEHLPAFGPAARSTGRGRLARALGRPSLGALVALAAVLIFFGLQAPELFTGSGVAAVLDTAAQVGIGGGAVALLLIGGQFDFSVGAVALGSSLVTALLIGHTGMGAWPALLVSLGAALAVGVVNGLLVVLTGAPSFLTTLATFLVLQGVTLAATHRLAGTTTHISGVDAAPGWDSAVRVFGSSVRLAGGTFHVSLLWWLGLTAAATWMLWRTRFGNSVLASGGARHAARKLGVPVDRTTVTLFCVTALAGWLIGTLGLVRVSGVTVTPGLGTEVDFVVVAVIGGCLLMGGFGSAVGAAVAALLYAAAEQGIRLAGWDQRWFQALLGVLLLVALIANGLVRRRLRAVPRA